MAARCQTEPVPEREEEEEESRPGGTLAAERSLSGETAGPETAGMQKDPFQAERRWRPEKAICHGARSAMGEPDSRRATEGRQ